MKIRYELKENDDATKDLKNFEGQQIKENSENKNIVVFGNKFVKNNLNKCKIILNGHLQKLKRIINNKNINNNSVIKIKLISLKNIYDLSEMFYDCEYLTKIDYFDKLKIKNITNIRGMFFNCKSLKDLPNCISKWKTDKIKDISEIFYGCRSLNKLPDISRWNTININNMRNTFFLCSSLTFLLLKKFLPYSP